ncbi:MAG: primosomal protein N', partial [Dehalococcoidia bacterium]
LEALKRGVKATGAARAVTSLMKQGMIARTYRLARPAVTTKMVTIVRLALTENEAADVAGRMRQEATKRSLKSAALIETLIREESLPLSQARRLGLTPSLQRALDGIVAVNEETLVRDPLAGRAYPYRDPPELTPDQSSATSEIIRALDAPDAGGTFLVHGVTGSGKTEVYLAALEHALSLGRRGIVLVPEIALTPQTIRRFAERFPGEIAVLHSELSPGEQHDIWHEISVGRYKAVVGPRGALFAPMPDLGLVIIDEEHEWTYKQQDGSPHYHARRTAEELCRLSGAVLVLGSATPDVETYFRADEGPLKLLSLPQRLVRSPGGVQPGPLPEVQIVDLREELKVGNRSIFSRSLTGEIQSALDASEQVILFLNRRGTASFVQCRDCGYTPECRSCAVALTYHEPDPRLVCHYCNRRYPPATACPECGGNRLRQIGLGTERVEEEVHRQFPKARTVRWDRDMTRGKGAHEAILARFLAHDADVLIGTQMVAKGLDIPLVTLVGVISADIALHIPDIRAGERAFQLLEQVAGRAGRGERPGRVIIQTYTPDHYAIEAASRHDYPALYAAEIELRRRLGYPPFGRLARLTFVHTGKEFAQREAARLAHHLRSERERRAMPNLDVLGPSPALIPRVRSRWRWNVVLRGADPAMLLGDQTLPRGWSVDIDPISIL